MNTTTLSITTDTQVAKAAKEHAKALGISFHDLLSHMTNDLLKNFVETTKKKRIDTTIILHVSAEPSKYLKRVIKEADIERERGGSSPVFRNPQDAIRWLNS